MNCSLRRSQRRPGRDGQDARRPVRAVRHAEQGRRAGVAAAPARRRGVDQLAGAAEPARAGRAERGQPEVVRAPAQPGHAQHRHGRRAARAVQRRLQPADALRLPEGPQGRDADARGRPRRGLRRGQRHARTCSSCWPPAAPASRRRPTSSSRRPGARCCCWSTARWSLLCFVTFRSWRAVVVRGAAAGADLDPGRGADGGAGHGREGGDAAGDRARRGHRRRLRALHPVGDAGAAARGQEPVARPTTARCCSPARW